MNKFNICKNYVTIINDMPVPKGALYGKDTKGYWVCIHKELYPLATPTLELYRWECEEIGWYLTIERSETVNYIKQCADKFDLWKVPIEYNKFKGLHQISANMDKTITRSKRTPFKTSNKNYAERFDYLQIPLDPWEKWISKTR